MSLASPQASLSPSNGSRKRPYSAINDGIENSQEREIREDIGDVRDVSHTASFAIRVCRANAPATAFLTLPKALSASVYEKPFTLQPLRIIRRSQLPLSFLDTFSTKSTLPTDRLYSGTLLLLENEESNREGTGLDPQILLAKLDDALYAIERIQNEVLALCRLASWVKPTYFDGITSSRAQELALRKMGIVGKDCSHIRTKSTTLLGPVPWDDAERPTKQLKTSMAPPSITDTSTKSGIAAPDPKTVPKTPKQKARPAPPKAPEEPVKLQASSEVVFATLVKHYLEALYWSKNSLAFFTKGPLSRARASFSSSTDKKMLVRDLTAFLRSMLLEVKSMDKKYRDKLPEMIKSFPPVALSEDEDAPPSNTKKRKPKKPKLSKDGVYTFEEDYVRRWWTSDDSNPGGDHDDTPQDRMRRRLGDLRSRETFAQIILILEIMALEVVESTTSEQSVNNGDQDHEKSENKKPKKKPIDLNLILDLLLDKLSIWQSIELDTGARPKKDKGDISSDKPVDQDVLGTFCTEVIVPFYKSRLPKKTAEVIKKLSGRGDSPKRKQKPKPKRGDPISRGKPPSNERRGLQKTNSDTQAVFRPPSLIRSATDSFIKRETSEVPLSAIPQLKSSRPPSRSRQPSITLQRLNRRQVDLSALSAASEAKLKRKATIDDELKEAITALKKPNRGLAIKDYVEASEQRVFASTSKRKQHPARRILQNVENVQVMATPRNVRKVNALAAKSIEHENHRDQMPLPSSSVVPASSIRPRGQPSGSQEKLHRFHPYARPSGTVTETPSRGPAKSTMFFSSTIGGTPNGKQTVSAFKIPSSAIKTMDRVTGIDQTPSKDRCQQPLSSTGRVNVFAPNVQTPSKSRSYPLKDTVISTPVKSNASDGEAASVNKIEGTKEMENRDETRDMSIYDALGWNDEIDELA